MIDITWLHFSAGPPSMAPDHRKQIDNLKKFSVDFRVSILVKLNKNSTGPLTRLHNENLLHLFQLQSSSSPDPAFDQMTKPVRDSSDKPKDLSLDKAAAAGRDGAEDGTAGLTAGGSGAATASSASKPGSPAAPSPSSLEQKRGGQDVTSQGVQTTAMSTLSGPKHEEKEEKKEAVQEWVDRID